MGWHTWGGTGPRANALLKKIDKIIAGDLQGWPKRQAVRGFRQKIVFCLMAFIGQQLQAVEDALPLDSHPGADWRDPSAPTIPPALLTHAELMQWDSEEEEDPPDLMHT